MTKPRILLVTHYYASHRGGVEIVAAKVAGHLVSRGYGVTWAASDTDTPPDARDGIEILPMKAQNFVEKKLGLPYPVWSRESLSQLRTKLQSSDVLHIHDSLYHGNVAAARAARRIGKPYIVTQHIGFVPYKSAVLRTALTIANRLVALPTLRGASGIGYVSETTQHYFEGLGLAQDKGELVPNGVDIATFTPEGPRDRGSFGFTEDRPLCVFVGRFVEKKGLPTIRQLATANPDVQWALAGWGPINPAEWNLPNVKVFRDLGGPTLTPLYRCADLLVMPSVGEGFPLVVQEAMACGTAAVISAETAEGYTPARPFLHAVPAADVEQWKATLAKLLANRSELQATTGQRAEFAKTYWSWDSCTDRYEALIRKALKL